MNKHHVLKIKWLTKLGSQSPREREVSNTSAGDPFLPRPSAYFRQAKRM